MSATLHKVRKLHDAIYARASREAYDWLHSLPGADRRRALREGLWPAVRDRWPTCDGCPFDLPDEEQAAYFKRLEEAEPTGTYESWLSEIAAINRFREKLEAERQAKMGTNGKN